MAEEPGREHNKCREQIITVEKCQLDVDTNCKQNEMGEK